MAGNNSNTLVDQKLAVSLFLDSLLREPEPEPELETDTGVAAPAVEVPVVEPVVETKAEAKLKQKVVVEEKIEIPTATPTPEPIIETKAEVKVQQEVPVEEKVETALETETVEEQPATAAEPVIPEWASEPFQVLLFEVGGLKLAVPLIELSGVIEWTDSVTEMPGHADFYMGILQHLEHKIAVIDTARMVLPTNKLSEIVGDNPRERVKHIVLIDDYRWGLACDEISEVITLEPNEVRWRTSRTSRDWLAGTVIEHMCALMNSAGFAAMLEKGQQGG